MKKVYYRNTVTDDNGKLLIVVGYFFEGCEWIGKSMIFSY